MSEVDDKFAEVRRLAEEAMKGLVIGGVDFTWALADTRRRVAEMYGCEVEEVEAELREHTLYFRLPQIIKVAFTITEVEA